jgi:hypothetical protein
MQNNNSTSNLQYNGLKIRTLTLFANYGWLTPRKYANLAGFSPLRASYSYLLRLRKFGLLKRTRDSKGSLVYGLTDRGRARLDWLTIPNGPKQSQPIPEETTHAVAIPNAF